MIKLNFLNYNVGLYTANKYKLYAKTSIQDGKLKIEKEKEMIKKDCRFFITRKIYIDIDTNEQVDDLHKAEEGFYYDINRLKKEGLIPKLQSITSEEEKEALDRSIAKNTTRIYFDDVKPAGEIPNNDLKRLLKTNREKQKVSQNQM